MSRYGIDYYGFGYYGTDNPVKYDATPFTAKPYDYNKMLLQWTDPAGSWSSLIIVRNSYGFPLNPWDGIQVVSAYSGQDPVSYLDTNQIVPGTFYYYSIFVFGLVQYNWVNAGTAMGIAVKNYGNTNKLYSYLPDIYKIVNTYVASADWDNTDLYNFLNNFGFELDREQTITDLLTTKYDSETVSGKLIPTMLNQFGLSYEPAIGLQQNRILLRNAVTLTKQKGSKAGLIAFIRAFTGWGVPTPLSGTPNPSVNGITLSHNLMLDYNDSSFEESIGHWASNDKTALVERLASYQITSLSLTSNIATLIIGSHQYEVGNSITISGLPLPLFNTSTPVTLTAVNQSSSISFSLTSSNVTSTSGYNSATKSYGTITPYPTPWVEATAPTLFPNKIKGILDLTNTSVSAQTITAYCGDTNPIQYGVPVTVSTIYTFSIYAAKGATARNVTPQIKWYDRFGVYLSTSSGTAVSDNTAIFSSSIRPYVTATSPATAAYAAPGVSIASVGGSATNEHHYFDTAQFELGSITSFDEARQIHLTLKANRINELINPNFVSPTTPWAVSTGSATSDGTLYAPNSTLYTVTSTVISGGSATVTFSTPHVIPVGSYVYLSNISGTGVTASNYTGARLITAVTINSLSFASAASQTTKTTTGSGWLQGNAFKVTSSGASTSIKSWDGSTTSQQMGIYYPGTSYTFSVYVQPVVTETVVAKISWYNVSNTLISTSSGASTSITAGIWNRPYVTDTAPATASYATVELSWTSAASTSIIYLDNALFENNGAVLTYFDGSSGNATIYELFWEGGTANAARSHYYKNRFTVQTRLYGAILNAQLPLGATSAVYLAQPKT